MEAVRLPELPPFTIRRSDRARRSRLTITDEGEAVVVLPARASEAEASDLVRRHRRWIENHQRRIRSRLGALAARPRLGAGRQILFEGELHRTVAIAAIDGRKRPSIRRTDGAIVVTSSPLEARSTSDLLDGWLRARARSAIEERVATRGREMGLAAKRITIRDQKTRWGSATRKGTLSFSWRLILCPPEVLDYVVVHELAHLKVAGHPRSFWRLVDRYVEDVRGARMWLREHQDEIRHALD
jgi:predicted metal-dependent hydrolase